MKIEASDFDTIIVQNDLKEKIKSRKVLKEIYQRQSNFKFYEWDFSENYTYITYLKYYKDIFEDPHARKACRVFVHLSKLLTTRTANQIKCHHQKMFNRHKSISGIIEFLRVKIIAYLRQHLQAIIEIERINVLCQSFFIREAEFQRKIRQDLYNKNCEDLKKMDKTVNNASNDEIKQQDDMERYEYGNFKNSQILEPHLKNTSLQSNQNQ